MNLNTYAIIRWRNLSKTQGRMSSKKPFYFQTAEITDKKYLASKASPVQANRHGAFKAWKFVEFGKRTGNLPAISGK